MKQLEDQTLFTFVEKNANQQAPSATLTSALYSIIFSHDNSSNNKSSSSNQQQQQQRKSSTTFPNDQRVKLKQNSRSKSHNNLITCSDDIINNNKYSCLRTSSSSVRESRGNFGLDDWFKRSESDCNLILDYDSEVESDKLSKITSNLQKSVNFNSKPDIKILNYPKESYHDELPDTDNQLAESILFNTIESHDSTNGPENTIETAAIITDSDHQSNIVYYKSHSNTLSRTSINSIESSSQDSRLTSSLSNSSITSRSCKSTDQEDLNDKNLNIQTTQINDKQDLNESTDNLAKLTFDNELKSHDNESEDDDWIFVGHEVNPIRNSIATDQVIKLPKSNTSFSNLEDQSLLLSSKSKSSSPKSLDERQQNLFPTLRNLSVNNSQFNDYIELYKDLLRDEYIGDIDLTHYQIMALNMNEIDLIRESWKPVRQDIVVHGIQLFRDLFTKFPSYKQYFTNFHDLDLERMHENKRLLRHATKVIETVSFVVDSIGHESKANDLNEALLNLVKGHLKRKIGTLEFKNLGIVLVDFICNVNNQRGNRKNSEWKEELASASATSLLISSSAQSVNCGPDKSTSTNIADVDSATMTDALDKLRKLSSSATSLTGSIDDFHHQKGTTGAGVIHELPDKTIRNRSSMPTSLTPATSVDISSSSSSSTNTNNIEQSKLISSNESTSNKTAGFCSIIRTSALDGAANSPSGTQNTFGRDAKFPLETNSLVAAWTKLYGVILGLVEREEALLLDQIQPACEAAN